MKTYGENVSNEAIVSKVLRSLTEDFGHVVAAKEDAKDLSNYSFDVLMSSLLAHGANKLIGLIRKWRRKFFN